MFFGNGVLPGKNNSSVSARNVKKNTRALIKNGKTE